MNAIGDKRLLFYFNGCFLLFIICDVFGWIFLMKNDTSFYPHKCNQ